MNPEQLHKPGQNLFIALWFDIEEKKAQGKLLSLVTSVQHQPLWPLKTFVEGSVTSDQRVSHLAWQTLIASPEVIEPEV